MFVHIEIRNGRNHSDYVTKSDIQRNIDALDRAAKHVNAEDATLLLGIASILIAIRTQLPG